MTLNTHIKVLWILDDFGAATDISKANCAEINRDRQRQAANEIFSIEHRFRRFKFQFLRFKKTCAQGHQERYPLKSRYFTVVDQSFVETVADRYWHAAYHNKH